MKSSFTRAVAVLATGTVVAQVIPIVLTPVMSRLFTPGDFGQLGLFTSFLSMSSATVGLSLPRAVASGASTRIAAQLVMLSLLATIPVSVVWGVGLYFFRRYELLGFGGLPGMAVPSVWIALMAIGVTVAFRYWLIRQELPHPIRRATIWRGVTKAIVGLVAGLLSLGGIGLIASELVGRMTGVSTMARASVSEFRAALKGSTYKDYRSTLGEHRKFILLGTPSVLLNSLALSIPGPLLAATYGLSIAGQFTMAYSVLALPLSLVGSSIADVFHGQLGRLARENPSQTRSLFLKVGFGLFAIGIIPLGAVVFIGPQAFAMVLGDQWRTAGAIAAGIAPWLLSSLVVSPLSRVVYVFQGQGLKLIYDILSLTCVVTGILVGWSLDWNIQSTARLLGVTQSFAYVVYFGLLWRILVSNIRGRSERRVD